MLSAAVSATNSKFRLLLSSLLFVAASSSRASSTKLLMPLWRSKLPAVSKTTARYTFQSTAFISPSRVRAFTSYTVRRDKSKFNHSTTRVYQNMMGFASNEEPNNNDEDEISKWERLYSNYQPQSSLPTAAQSSSTFQTLSSTKSEIRIITFDLDNTLWRTSETITHANTVLFESLQSKFGIGVRSEVEMGKLFREFPERYCGLLEEVNESGGGEETRSGGDDGNNESVEEYANSVVNVGRTDTTISSPNNDDGVHITSKKKKKPVYLTLLRKDAIRSLLLQQQQSLTPLELEEEVNEAFNIWMEARTQSISQNFAPFALETLSHLKSSLVQTCESNKKVYIGAITDGNSNPQSVPELSGLFDFVIKAEDVGVSKPDKRVYKAAVAELMLQLIRDGMSVEEFFLGEAFQGSGGDVVDAGYLMSDCSSSSVQETSWKDIDPDAVEAFSEAVGPWWVHIGDDFFKDIVAAKEFRMRSVWMRELIGGAEAFGSVAAEGADSGTKRSVEDLVNDIAKNNGAIQMAIGDSDFLTSALHEEFSDAILDRFADLSDLLIQWNEEGNGNCEPVIHPNMEVASGDYPAAPSSAAPPPPQTDELDRSSTKFCFACGEKIPAVARFCPGCGERQS